MLKPKDTNTPDIKTKNYKFSDILNYSDDLGFPKKSIRQYLELYFLSREKEQPIILELGTRNGISTTVFLQACAEKGGRLFSVDIEDFSDVAPDNNDWQFIQSDSTDVQNVLSQAPQLEKGIDVLLIDSLHKSSHVHKELTRWMPYMNKDAVIFFDDLDPLPYLSRHKKDNVALEFDWFHMHQVVMDLFYNNEDDFDFQMIYGSTGLGILKKHTDLGTPLKENKKIKRRTQNVFWIIAIGLRRLKNKLLKQPY